MNYSYWEHKTWLSKIDCLVIGSGIVGLSCALRLRARFPKSKIVILERGVLPNGASTKNAGFACFGSISEIIDDLKNHSEDQVQQLVKQRYQGLQLLRKTLGDQAISYQQHGGYELFTKKDIDLYTACVSQKDSINELLHPIFKQNIFYTRTHQFNPDLMIPHSICNPLEGQIDTGDMMQNLLLKTQLSGIKIFNNCTVEEVLDTNTKVAIQTNHGTFTANKVCIATNGFASQLGIDFVKPARAQVLITEPIKNLPLKGTFHMDKGYYYFRNVDQRILLGGGRQLDFKTEETTTMGQTKIVQQKLEEILKTIILPKTNLKIQRRWSGIMGIGNQKTPIIKQISNNIYCGVRLGGMGIAIGSSVGTEVANLI